MNNNDLYRGITAVDPALVEEAMAPSPRARLVKLTRYALTTAACLALVVVGGYQMLLKPVSIVYVTINPHVSVSLNRMGGVTGVTALNEDGVTLLEGYNARGKDRLTVTQELIDRAREMGYLTDQGQVTISVEAPSANTAQQYGQEFEAYGQSGQVDVNVRSILPFQQVQEIAMTHFSLTSATLLSIQCQAEHDRAIYEIELRSGQMEYECTIDAVTGQVLSSEVEQADGQTAQTPDSPQLTQEQARQAALSHAGLAGATFTKTELEQDDGRWEYEFEFSSGNYRYECTVDAITGAVLDFEGKLSQTTAASGSGQAASAQVSLQQAKNAALKRAGLTTATFTKAQLEWDDGQWEYDLEFYTDRYEYDCTVNAATGAVVDYEEQRISQPTGGAGSTGTASAAQITQQQAQDAALKRAGLSSATFTKAQLEQDDGQWEYDLEFYTDTTEYDCTVDAVTGAVLDYEQEPRKRPVTSAGSTGNTGGSTSAQITQQQAESAALSRAGLISATFTKVELEQDNGRWEYDLEFYAGNTEYDCTVDAATGAVLDFEADMED